MTDCAGGGRERRRGSAPATISIESGTDRVGASIWHLTDSFLATRTLRRAATHRTPHRRQRSICWLCNVALERLRVLGGRAGWRMDGRTAIAGKQESRIVGNMRLRIGAHARRDASSPFRSPARILRRKPTRHCSAAGVLDGMCPTLQPPRGTHGVDRGRAYYVVDARSRPLDGASRLRTFRFVRTGAGGGGLAEIRLEEAFRPLRSGRRGQPDSRRGRDSPRGFSRARLRVFLLENGRRADKLRSIRISSSTSLFRPGGIAATSRAGERANALQDARPGWRGGETQGRLLPSSAFSFSLFFRRSFVPRACVCGFGNTVYACMPGSKDRLALRWGSGRAPRRR